MMNELRIVHIVHWPASGVGSIVKMLISRHAAPSVRSELVVLDGNRAEAERVGYQAADVLTLDLHRRPIQTITRLARFMRSRQPSIVHSHSLTPMLLAAACRGAFRRVRTVHSPYPYLTERNPRSLAKVVLERAAVHLQDAVVVVSEDIRPLVSARLRPARLLSIPNGVERHDARRSSEERHPPIVGAVGRLSREKGFDVLLSAAGVLLEEGFQFKLKIAGDGPERSALERQIDRLSLAESVEMVGFLKDIPTFLVGCDLLVSSSVYEGAGLSGFEALSLGLPVVTTPTGPLSRAVAEMRHGVVAAGFSSRDVASALAQCLSGLQAFRGRASITRALVEQQYSSEKMANEYMNLYRSLQDSSWTLHV